MDAQNSQPWMHQPDQETIINIDGEIYELVITLGCVTKLKQRIET